MPSATIPFHPLRYLTGQLLAALLPQRRLRQEAQFTFPAGAAAAAGSTLAGPGFIDRLIRDYLGHRHAADPKRLEGLHRRFWERQTPEDWYQLGPSRHKTRHVPIFGPLVSALGNPLKARGIESVVEFGCGDGRWLAWLNAQWPSIRHFHGVDLSLSQIQANRSRYPDMAFDAMDLVAWARQHARPHSLFLTQCGVLEYLARESVDELLTVLRQRAPDSMVCFIEPIAAELDLNAADQPSTPHGREFAWSHHYPARLRAAGLILENVQTREMDGYRMLVIVGRIPPDPAAKPIFEETIPARQPQLDPA